MTPVRVPQPVTPDPWDELAIFGARLALGRAGAALPTREILKLGMAHARARDAVFATLDVPAMEGALGRLDLPAVRVDSAAPNREAYLRRPDFGRRLSAQSRDLLAASSVDRGADLALVIADGLSATAVDRNAPALLDQLVPALRAAGRTLAPVAIAAEARVALGDEIGQVLRARLVLVLIGERPGLSSAHSMGAYLTFAPRVGRSDAERNCVSNIREGGLSPCDAAAKLAWLIERATTLSLTGIGLKDGSVPRLALPLEQARRGWEVEP